MTLTIVVPVISERCYFDAARKQVEGRVSGTACPLLTHKELEEASETNLLFLYCIIPLIRSDGVVVN